MSACQPLFLVSYAESTHRYNAVAATNVGTILSQGAQKAGLCDYRTIREKEKLKELETAEEKTQKKVQTS